MNYPILKFKKILSTTRNLLNNNHLETKIISHYIKYFRY